jgi:DNA invertase Pin-like site-specific DNA recombinase
LDLQTHSGEAQVSAYIYARVSTFEQFHSGFSIDNQCTSGLTYVKNNLLLPGMATIDIIGETTNMA